MCYYLISNLNIGIHLSIEPIRPSSFYTVVLMFSSIFTGPLQVHIEYIIL